MDSVNFLLFLLQLSPLGWRDYVPADHISRQAWQEVVMQLIDEPGNSLGQAWPQPTDAEISVHYHLPLRDFAALLDSKEASARKPESP